MSPNEQTLSANTISTTGNLQRLYNFSAGPSTMPLSVLKKAQDELLNYQANGMSIMEMSHRSKTFQSVLADCKAGIKDILNVPDTHDILFLQGGASLQFTMVPMNLALPQRSVDVINTGSWTKKAIKALADHSEYRIVATSEDSHFDRIPSVTVSDFSEEAAYAYLTSNNTIFGTQFQTFPDTGDVPLVADMSSDIMSRPLSVSDFGLIFAGAQKNLGPSGVTLVIIDTLLAQRAQTSVPDMLLYRTHIEQNSLYNTPPTFGIYLMGLMMEWISSQGGLGTIEARNKEKAQLIYDLVDDSDFYEGPVQIDSRSVMNVVFKLADEALESAFLKGAEAKGLSGLKGHRSVGGMRASIYNAMPVEGVQALVAYMKEFRDTHA